MDNSYPIICLSGYRRARAITKDPHPEPRSIIGPLPVFSTAETTALRALPELGMGVMPVFMDVMKMDKPAKRIRIIIRCIRSMGSFVLRSDILTADQEVNINYNLYGR